MISGMLANMLFRPGQASLFDSPNDYGLDYEDVTFEALDGTKLRGWLIPGDGEKVIIQSHFGTMCCRSGYTNNGKGMMKAYDHDIHFLNQAKYLHEAGYTVLMYDFRGHGESEPGPKHYITWGPEEAKDIIAAVDFISQHPDYKDAAIGLLSICMGQGASTEAFGLQNGLAGRAHVKAMISVQPLDFETFIGEMGVPSFLQNGVRKTMIKRTGMDVVADGWRPHVKSIDVPTLVIQNRNDGYLNESFVNGFYDALQVEKEMRWIDIPKKKSRNSNRLAAYEWIGKNPEPILAWFEKHVR